MSEAVGDAKDAHGTADIDTGAATALTKALAESGSGAGGAKDAPESGAPTSRRRGTLATLRITVLPGSAEQRSWYEQMRWLSVVLPLLWLLIPIDPEQTGRVQPELWAFVFHAAYGANAVGVGWVLFTQILPPPSIPVRATTTVLTTALYAVLIYATHAAGFSRTELAVVTPACLIVSAVPLTIFMAVHVRSLGADAGRARKLSAAFNAATPTPGATGTSASAVASSNVDTADGATLVAVSTERQKRHLQRAVSEGAIMQPYMTVFKGLAMAFGVLFAAFYFGQLFTSFFESNEFTDTERVLLVFAFQVFMIGFRVAMGRVAQQKKLRSRYNVAPDGARLVLLFGLTTLGMAFQRNLFQQFESTGGVIISLVQRALLQILLGPVRLTRWGHALSARLRACARLQSHGFLEDSRDFVVDNFYQKLGEFVSLVTWFGGTVLGLVGWNRRVYPFEAKTLARESTTGEALERDVLYLLLFVVFEVLLLVIVRAQATRLNIDIFKEALAPMERPLERLSFVLLGQHVVQDVYVALVTPLAQML